MNYCYVETSFGRIKGEQTAEGRIFHSIPFAVTERFESPQPVEPWGEFDATARQINCHQRFEYVDESSEDNNFYYREFDFNRDSRWAETPTCLTIITPDKAEKLPVLVYFHGGSFENGCIDDVPFGSSFEYARRGIILVSCGYRLNVFGLYGSRNYGLQDMEFGINWVRENIEAFGGDPDHIVIMGQSAGAMCLNDLLLDNRLAGTVKGAIMMSGGGLIPDFAGPKPAADSAAFWTEVMKRAGCNSEAELRQIEPQKLWQAWYDNKQSGAPMSAIQPAVDGIIVRDQPKNIVKRNEDLDVPLLIGVTSQDIFPYMILDMMLNMGKRNAKNGRSPVYCYYFDHELPGKVYKAFHAADLWYMFGSFEKSWRPFEQFDVQLKDMMIDYNANFIRNLDPNGKNLPEWQPLTRRGTHLRHFHKNGKTYISPTIARSANRISPSPNAARQGRKAMRNS